MMRRTGLVGALIILFSLVLVTSNIGRAAAQDVDESRSGCVRGQFLDYLNQPAPGERLSGATGPLFSLSQNYPDSRPAPSDSMSEYPWLDVDISALDTDEGALRYINVIKEYVLDGNVAVDWVVQDNPTRTWYHVPWLDTTIDGREYHHGLTRELSTPPGVLAPEQSKPAETWAMGAYNAPGGWAIGQVWCDPENPSPAALNPDVNGPNSFPNGTAVFKLLFTSATLEQAPFLEGTKVWRGNIYPDSLPKGVSNANDPTNNSKIPERVDRDVRLIQMDVAVRDDRLPLGWAFLTFAYSAIHDGETVYDRMAPVGLQWGNDPGKTPAMLAAGDATLTGGWINGELLDRTRYFDNHLGWGGRLSGPLDNPNSSCMSCHQTAGSPAAPLVPEAASWFELGDRTLLPDRERLPWFTDTPAGVPFSITQRQSVDYSLQLAIGLQRFYVATCHPNLLDEVFSARGPGSSSPADAATSQGECDELAATVVPPSQVQRPGWVTAIQVLGGLLLGLVLAQLWGRKTRTTSTKHMAEHEPANEGELL